MSQLLSMPMTDERCPRESALYPRVREGMGKLRPDFVILGAMKCGTTSVHHILESHPGVFMPRGEVKFFSYDDVTHQPQVFAEVGGRWTCPSWHDNMGELLDWYRSIYGGKQDGMIAGEDSPSYLESEKSLRRIAGCFPDMKLIVCLRDPVERTYSHYWHNLRSYAVFWDFETTLRHTPGLMLERSFYRQNVERLLRWFPRD